MYIHVNVHVYMYICIRLYTVKPVFKVHSDKTPINLGAFFQKSVLQYLSHIKEPVMKGHLSCTDHFSGVLECSLKTGFTVLRISLMFSIVNCSEHGEYFRLLRFLCLIICL